MTDDTDFLIAWAGAEHATAPAIFSTTPSPSTSSMSTPTGPSPSSPPARAGNAVLAAIAASDALTCLRLGCHNRGQGHGEGAALLRTIRPDGPRLAKDLSTALGVKDAAHYGSVFVSATTLKSTLRAAGRFVDAAERATTG